MRAGKHVASGSDVPYRPLSTRPSTWFAIAFLVAGVGVAIPFGVHAARSAVKPTPRATAAAPAGSTPVLPPGWQSFVAPDGSFDLIGPADATTSAVQTVFGAAHVAKFSGGALTVAWTDRSVSRGVPDPQLLTQEVSRIVQPIVGRTADQEEQLSDGGHPGYGLVFTVQGTEYRIRVFAARGRLYEITSVTQAGSIASKDAQRFVDSFELR